MLLQYCTMMRSCKTITIVQLLRTGNTDTTPTTDTTGTTPTASTTDTTPTTATTDTTRSTDTTGTTGTTPTTVCIEVQKTSDNAGGKPRFLTSTQNI